MNRRPRLLQAGFTLAELMISMVIGMFIMLALIALLINVNRNNGELGTSNRMIENGRFAMQLLTADIEHAGYWGGHVPNHDDLSYNVAPTSAAAGGDVPSAIPNPCLDYSVVNWTAEHKANLVAVPVAGGNVTTAAAVPFCGGVVTSPATSSDVLVVRHAESCVAGSGADECANTAGEVYFQAARCATQNPKYKLSAAAADLDRQQRTCVAASLAEIRRFASTLYFVKRVNGVPTLMRSTFGLDGGVPKQRAAQALVENVEAIRVEFGIDNKSDTNENVAPTAAISWTNPNLKTSPRNRGDGIPDGSYLRCTQATPCTADQMLNAVSVKLYVLVRGEAVSSGHTDTKKYKMGSSDTLCATADAADTSAACAPVAGPFDDRYRRHLFTQTIRLVNVVGRRETP